MLELQSWNGIKQSTETQALTQRPLLHIKFDTRKRRILWRSYLIQEADSLAERYSATELPEGPDWLTTDAKQNNETVLVFGTHPDLGQWVQQPRITREESCVLLVHQTQYYEVRSYLNTKAQSGWVEADFDGIPSGWHCFRGVEILKPDPNAKWESLKIQGEVTIRFRGGLKIDRNVYLVGFEPMLYLHSSEPNEKISLDGKPIFNNKDGTININLAKHNLPAGYHKIVVGNYLRNFFTRQPHRKIIPSTEQPRIAYRLTKESGTCKPIDDGPVVITQENTSNQEAVYISGAVVYGNTVSDDSIPHMIVVPGGFKRYVVLGKRPGDIFEYEGKKAIRGKGTIHNQQPIRLTIFFEPQWLIKINRKNKRYLSTIYQNVSNPIHQTQSSSDLIKKWVYWVLRSYKKRWGTHKIDGVWAEYRHLAQEIDEGLL
jgi:hypothetical protein